MRTILRTILAAIALLVFTGGVITVPARAADVVPKIEVAFVLDTTGSMGQLIGGAKQKIWTIARQIAAGKPAPAVKLSLVGYRDRGEEYVTKMFDLSDDLDAIYGNLMAFQAARGGDTPESVNQALHEAVTKVAWSKDTATLRIIFLVGDAPPHMDYPDDVKYPETIQLAKAAGIIINTIQCGNMAATTPFWQEIASLSGGGYVQIDQSGGMTATATPVDAELARVGAELTRTAVPYGNATLQSEVRSKGGLAVGADVDRLVYLNLDRAEFGMKSVVTGEGELIWAVVNNKVKLEDIPESDLPVQLKSMNLQARKEFVDQQFTKRKELQIRVDELARERESFVKAEMEKLMAKGAGDSFDVKVAEMVQTQAQRKGIKYEIIAPGKAPAK
jgi:hypothetical protein